MTNFGLGGFLAPTEVVVVCMYRCQVSVRNKMKGKKHASTHRKGADKTNLQRKCRQTPTDGRSAHNNLQIIIVKEGN